MEGQAKGKEKKTGREAVYECRKGDLIAIEGGKTLIFQSHGKQSFRAVDPKTSIAYAVPKEMFLRIVKGGMQEDNEPGWEDALKAGELFYIYRKGKCELYSLKRKTGKDLECIVPHTDEPVRIRRGTYEGGRVLGNFE